MKKKKNAVMIADTRSALIGNLLVQIKETNPNLFEEAIVYYDDMPKKDMEVMSKILPVRFIKMNYDFPKKILNKPSFIKFSHLMFARYYMFDLLDEYETITWIDTDVLICGDISSIIDKAIESGMSANFEDEENKSYLHSSTIMDSFEKPVKGYDMTRYNMSSGLITVADTLKDYKEMTDWCFENTIKYSDYLTLPDQGVLNLLIQEFNIDVASVGENGAYCFYPTYRRDPEHAKIVHAWGARKFWKSWYLFNTYPKWYEYYNKWLSLGGSDYFGEIKPDVSIIIPSYNTNVEYFNLVLEDLLVNQVQNAGFQYDNFEILVVIDGDISNEFNNLVEQYDDPRLTIIHNPKRMGIAKSLNIGIKKAKGRYIARIDDDDRIMPKRLFEQVTYLDKNKDINLVSSYFQYFGDLNEPRITLEGEMCHAWSIFTCPFDHPTIMFRKDFFVDNNLFYDEKRSHVEDWELWLRAFEKGLKVGVIPEILYKHRWYNGQAGQNQKTIDMMRDLVRKNFEKLNVSLTDDELVYVSPWQGKVEGKKLKRLKSIYEEALKNNLKLKIYDQDCLKKVFDYRLEEATTGILSSMILDTSKIDEKNSSTLKRLFLKSRIGKRINNKIHYVVMNNVDYYMNNITDIKSEIDNLNKEIVELKDKNEKLANENYQLKVEIDRVINNYSFDNRKVRYIKGEKIRIMFFFQIASFWPSWESVYEAIKNNSEIEYKFVLLDFVNREPSQMKGARDFLINNNIEFEDYSDELLDNFNPHIVMMETPYDNWHRTRELSSGELIKRGIRLVYIPYGLEISTEKYSNNLQYELAFISNMWKIYVINESMKKNYLRYGTFYRDSVTPLGHPKFDGLFLRHSLTHYNLREKYKGKKIVLLKAHFRKEFANKDGSRFSVTPDENIYIDFFKKAKDYKDYIFVFLPHPKFYDYMSEGLKLQYKKVLNQDNIIVFNEEDYREALYMADYIICDRSAVMIEIVAMNKPTLYMHNPNNEEKITDTFVEVVDSYYKGTTANDIVDFLKMCESGVDSKKKDREKAFKNLLRNYDGKIGKRIVDDMVETIKKEE